MKYMLGYSPLPDKVLFAHIPRPLDPSRIISDHRDLNILSSALSSGHLPLSSKDSGYVVVNCKVSITQIAEIEFRGSRVTLTLLVHPAFGGG